MATHGTALLLSLSLSRVWVVDAVADVDLFVVAVIFLRKRTFENLKDRGMMAAFPPHSFGGPLLEVEQLLTIIKDSKSHLYATNGRMTQ